MSGPLSTLKIVEMVGLGPCPLAGQLLADMGAEVIVIDRKSGMNISGEINRRGKKSIAIDLKSQRGIETALALIARADVLIEGFRPGVMERLGLGPDVCMSKNTKLIYGRMTGWGQDGPLSHAAGHDINYLAITGALHAMGKDGEPPSPPLNLAADYGGGSMFLIMGVLSAIIERSHSSRGQVVDAAMCEGVPAMMGLIHTRLARGDWTNKRQNNFIDGGAPYYRCYKTADEKFVAVGAIEPQFFAELIQLLELDNELIHKQNDKAHWPKMHQVFETTFATKTRDDWAKIFNGTDACVSPVLNFEEAKNFPHNKYRNTFVEAEGVMQTGITPRLSRNHRAIPEVGRQTGENTREVLLEAGLNKDMIDTLEKDGVLM